ncbi:MAG: hypothetical protein ACOC5H_02105 [Desulfovermiculus sp.]
MFQGRNKLSFQGKKRWLLLCFLAGLVILVLAEMAVHKHPAFDWAGTYGFFAGYGLISCLLLVLLARILRPLVMRSEDYYDL